MLAQTALKLSALCLLLTLPACTTYKTREFTQINTPRFESWNITAVVSAFNQSSGASWDDHGFRVSGNVTRYPQNADTIYAAKATDMTLHAGACGSSDLIAVKPLKFKEFGKSQNGRAYVAASEQAQILPDIEAICMRITAQFTALDGSESHTETFDINMKRNEKSMPGPVMN